MKKILHVFFLVMVSIAVAVSAQARNNILSGGAFTSLDYEDRNNNNDEADGVISDDEETTRFIISPFIRITSSSERDSLEFYYAPGFSWDLEESDNYTNHDLELRANRFFTRQWNVSFSNIYRYTDDPGASRRGTAGTETDEVVETTAATEPNTDLSTDAGRRRYQTNRLNLLSEYTYLEDSVFSLGYTFSILQNEDTGINGYDDYDRHEGYFGLSYRFNPKWKASFDGRYVRGLFDPAEIPIDSVPDLSDDLKEYHADLKLDSDIFPNDPWYLLYAYIGTKYDEALRDDNDIHQMTLGWSRDISPRMTFGLGGGPAYSKTEGSDGEWRTNGFVDFLYRLERGTLELGASGGYDQRNFSGTDQRGSIEFFELNASFNYNFTPYLLGIVTASYRDEDREDLIADDDTIGLSEYSVETYEAGAELQYSFWQYYFASVSYDYRDQESERNRSNYDEHRLYLSIGVEKDLFKW